MSFKEIVLGVEDGLQKMKMSNVSTVDFNNRLEKYKHFNYISLNDDEVFWMLTYVMFFNMGKKASMIEKKLPLLKPYLYGYEKLTKLSEVDIKNIINSTGFNKQVNWVISNAIIFNDLIKHHGSFKGYLEIKFGIKNIYCSNQQLLYLYNDLKLKFKGIGETAGWHFITELGFFSLKPDSVIRRIFYRLGLISSEDNLLGSIEVGRKISMELNIPIRYLDIIFVKFGQVGQSDLLGTIDGICTEKNPKCGLCNLKGICKYSSGELERTSTYIEASVTYDNEFDIEVKKINMFTNAERNNNKIELNNFRWELTSKFKDKYDKAPENLKILFSKLVGGIDDIGIEHFSTNTPDYRLKNRINFCLITFDLQNNSIRIHLRIDDIKIVSDSLEIKQLIKHHYNGRSWIEIKIKDISEIGEAINLIGHVYRHNN